MEFKNKFIFVILINIVFNLATSQSLQDLERLRKEYENRDSYESTQSSTRLQPIFDQKNFNADVIRYTDQQNKGSIEDSLKINYFGYDFLTKRDTVNFWENLPIPRDYVVGPGDELIISIWGQTQIRNNYVVTREGKIYDEKIGIILVSGKSIEELKKFLKIEFGRVYSTLKSSSPSSFIDISLGQLRSINVNFVGEVEYPGVYAIHSFSNLITGLIRSGGVKKTGSLRKIFIKRSNEKILTLDLYKYFMSGDLPKNIQLKDQDIVVVPVRKTEIEVDSAVVRPGIYESLEGETVKDLILYSGGLKKDASKTISLKRIVPILERSESSPSNQNYYINLDDADEIIVQNGDQIAVKNIFKSLLRVEIFGQVKKQGQYNYYDGMTFGDLIELSGGFTDTTFAKSIYTDQAEIIRRDPASRYEKIIKVNLNEFYENESARGIKLNNLDRVIIHANLNFFERKNIKISGEVNIPGEYPLIRDGEDLNSIIMRAGGYTSKALENGIAIFREYDINENLKTDDDSDKSMRQRVAWENTSIKLMPNDSIVVRESTKTISITGEIYNPGIISFKEGRSVSYYINSAGGLTNQADKNKIIVIFANGVVSPKKRFNNIKVSDGAHIVVNKKEPQEPFNLTQFATNWTSIISSMITAVVLSRQI